MIEKLSKHFGRVPEVCRFGYQGAEWLNTIPYSQEYETEPETPKKERLKLSLTAASDGGDGETSRRGERTFEETYQTSSPIALAAPRDASL